MFLHAAAHKTVTEVFLTNQVVESHLYLIAAVLESDLAPHNRLSLWSRYPIDCGIIPSIQNYPYCPCLSADSSKAHGKVSFCISQVTVHVTYDHSVTPLSHTSTSDSSNWKRLETVKSENHR